MKICKITFLDGAWIKAEIPAGADRIEYVLANFGMFSEIADLPESDAAVQAATTWNVFLVGGRKLFSGPYEKCFAYLNKRQYRVTQENHTTRTIYVRSN
jgi:hypothetical protein